MSTIQATRSPRLTHHSTGCRTRNAVKHRHRGSQHDGHSCAYKPYIVQPAKRVVDKQSLQCHCRLCLRHLHSWSHPVETELMQIANGPHPSIWTSRICKQHHSFMLNSCSGQPCLISRTLSHQKLFQNVGQTWQHPLIIVGLIDTSSFEHVASALNTQGTRHAGIHSPLQ